MITNKQYLEGALSTATYPQHTILGHNYVSLGLSGEAGEVCDKVKKLIRDKNWDGMHIDAIAKEDRHSIILELGDVLWYCYIWHYERFGDNNPMNNDEPLPKSIYGYKDLCISASLLANAASNEDIKRCIGMISHIAFLLDSDIQEVARLNLEKLDSRKSRNKISGSGDDR